ncbi:MAG: hydrogenase maturation protease [Anaerolineae bacterium]
MERVLILGYGNVSRQDDGVGYHVVNALARRLGREPLAVDDDGLDARGHRVDLACVHQLTPELADILAEYDEVLFVDAHTGTIEDEIRWTPVDGHYIPSGFTHHMTPGALLLTAKALHGRAPRAHLISVRGYEFGFGTFLSPRTAKLCQRAAEMIARHLQGAGLMPAAEGGEPGDA